MAIRFWLAVMHRDTARASVREGSVYVAGWPTDDLAVMREADGIAVYSPRTSAEGEPLKYFTALGRISRSEGQVRREVDFFSDRVEAPIRPLLGSLEFTSNRLAWGAPLKRGLVEISRHDFFVIAEATRLPSADDRLPPSRETGRLR